MTINELLNKYQNTFYLLGRIFALCFFAPYILYSANKLKNHTMLLLGILLFLWVAVKLWIQVIHNDLRGSENQNKLYTLYFIIRVFALCIVGPYLIYNGNKTNNNILVFLGIYIMIWDGAKIGVQLYYNDFSY
jgi:arginine exporter protein ArgO